MQPIDRTGVLFGQTNIVPKHKNPLVNEVARLAKDFVEKHYTNPTLQDYIHTELAMMEAVNLGISYATKII